MMKKILIAACALALLGGQAAAQNYTTPPAEAVETLESGIVKYSNLRYGPIPRIVLLCFSML